MISAKRDDEHQQRVAEHKCYIAQDRSATADAAAAWAPAGQGEGGRWEEAGMQPAHVVGFGVDVKGCIWQIIYLYCILLQQGLYYNITGVE